MKIDGTDRFDAEKAECYFASDRDRLFSISKFGFGTVDEFSVAVSCALKEKELFDLILSVCHV